MTRLTSKPALITGAARGIGLAVAEQLVDENATPRPVGDRRRFVRLDVVDARARKDAAAEARDDDQPIDIAGQPGRHSVGTPQGTQVTSPRRRPSRPRWVAFRRRRREGHELASRRP